MGRTLITSTEMINAFDVARLALENRAFFESLEREMPGVDLPKLYQTLMDFLDGDLRR